ncbi:MAG: hypothetical protein ABIH82_00070 [Candidatus Woesearchaeota archaeon]
MKHKEINQWPYITIVSIVAIVAIVFLVINNSGNSTITEQDSIELVDEKGNLVGEGIRVSFGKFFVQKAERLTSCQELNKCLEESVTKDQRDACKIAYYCPEGSK